jgi:phage-related protein
MLKYRLLAGVDLGNLTGGLFNLPTLLEGNNLLCFTFQALQVGLSDILVPLVSNVSGAVQKLTSVLGPILQNAGCQPLSTFESSTFEQFSGFTQVSVNGTY